MQGETGSKKLEDGFYLLYQTTDGLFLTKMNFNLIAPFYEVSARLVFGNEHRRAETFFLPEIPAHSRVLLVGGGAGHLLAELLQTRFPADVAYLEPSLAMSQRAHRRIQTLPGKTTVTFLRGSEELAGHPPYHVLVTPYILDVFPDEVLRTDVLPPLLRMLTPGAHWLFTDFVPPTRCSQALLISVMYAFFRAIARIPARRLPDYKALFEWAGFEKKASRAFANGMIETALLEPVPPKENVRA